jgi:glycosyltransferase involved in cell wall biosynthesis
MLRGYAGISVTAAHTLLLAVRLAKTVPQHHVDVLRVYGTLWENMIATFLVSKMFRIPFVVSVHGNWREIFASLHGEDSGVNLRRLVRSIELLAMTVLDRIILHDASAVICASESIRDTVCTHVPSARVSVIPTWGLDFESIEEEPKDMGIPELPLLTYIGRISPEKNLEELIQAFKDISVKYRDAQLLLVGDALTPTERKYRNRIVSLVKFLGLDDRVIFKGFIPHSEVGSIISKSFAVIICSRSEGLPHPILEALARGKLVICTSVGDCRRLVVDGQTGIIIENPSRDGIARAICRALGESEISHRIERNISKSIVQEYSMKTSVAREVRLLLGLVDNP